MDVNSTQKTFISDLSIDNPSRQWRLDPSSHNISPSLGSAPNRQANIVVLRDEIAQFALSGTGTFSARSVEMLDRPTCSISIVNENNFDWERVHFVSNEQPWLTNLSISGAWHRWFETTRELLSENPQTTNDTAANLRVERLSKLQAILGFPTLETAKCLGITRQNLYKWLDPSKGITLHEENRKRLIALEGLAKYWGELTKAPLVSVAQEPLNDGSIILDLLSAEYLDEKAVKAAFKELAEKLKKKPKTLSQRIKEAGFKRRPSPRSLDADE